MDCPFCKQPTTFTSMPDAEEIQAATEAFLKDATDGGGSTCPFCAQGMSASEVSQALRRMSAGMGGTGSKNSGASGRRFGSGSPSTPAGAMSEESTPFSSSAPSISEGGMTDAAPSPSHPELPDTPPSGSYTSSSSGASSGSSWWGCVGCIGVLLLVVLGTLCSAWITARRNRSKQETPPQTQADEAATAPSASGASRPTTTPTEGGASADALIERAVAAKSEGRLPAAEQALRSALQVDPASVRARMALAWTLVALERREEAKAEFQVVVDSAPAGPDRDEAAAALARMR